MEEHIKFAEESVRTATGSAGLRTQAPGCAATVGNLASATGGIRPGNIISTDK